MFTLTEWKIWPLAPKLNEFYAIEAVNNNTEKYVNTKITNSIRLTAHCNAIGIVLTAILHNP